MSGTAVAVLPLIVSVVAMSFVGDWSLVSERSVSGHIHQIKLPATLRLTAETLDMIGLAWYQLLGVPLTEACSKLPVSGKPLVGVSYPL